MTANPYKPTSHKAESSEALMVSFVSTEEEEEEEVEERERAKEVEEELQKADAKNNSRDNVKVSQ